MVFRRRCSLLLLIASAMLLCAVARAQQGPMGSSARTRAAAQRSSNSDLSSLEQAHSDALKSGDADSIASASRALAMALTAHLEEASEIAGDSAAHAIYASISKLLQGSQSPAMIRDDAQQPNARGSKQIDTAKLEINHRKVLLSEALNDLGTGEARQGQFSTAQAFFQGAADLNSQDAMIYLNLGKTAFRNGDYPVAISSLGRLATGGQGMEQALDTSGRLLYAMSFFSVGRFAEAAKAFSLVEVSALQDPRTAYSWAFSLAHSGDPAKANLIATQLAAQPLDPPILSLVCHIFMDTESYEQTIGCYRSLVAEDPNFPLAHYQIGESLIRQDKPGDAITELRQELQISPDDPNVQYSMAFALLQVSRKQEARVIFSKLTSEHPDMAQPQYQLGKLYVEEGHLGEAADHFEAAEKADPSADYIHYQLQAIYRKLGRASDAEREMQLYRDIKAKRRETPSSR